MYPRGYKNKKNVSSKIQNQKRKKSMTSKQVTASITISDLKDGVSVDTSIVYYYQQHINIQLLMKLTMN